MANTIKIKRSQTTATPASLVEGELAYSEMSKNLFIGTAGGNLEKIGGNTDVVKLSGIASGAEVNQNAFTSIAVAGQTTISALAKTDTLTIIGQNGLAITTNAATKTLTLDVAHNHDLAYQPLNSLLTTISGLTTATNQVILSTGPGTLTMGTVGTNYITNSAVTNAKLANMVQNTIKGRATASTGAPEDLTPLQVRTMLNVADGANNYTHPNHTGDITSTSDGATVYNGIVPVNKGGSGQSSFVNGELLIGNTTGNTLSKATLTAGTGITITNGAGSISIAHTSHTGDVTGQSALTIANSAVTLAKMANLPANTIIGNNTGGAVAPLALTPAQVRTLINVEDGANNYVHSTSGAGSRSGLAGATVINGITISSEGHVSSTTTRELSVTDIGAAPLNNPVFTGTVTVAADPVLPMQVATKQYVDARAAGLDPKESVRVATTGNITLSELQSIDGVTVVTGDRVLVKNQSVGSQNGIYIAAVGSWTRSPDADVSAEVTPGMFTFVELGTVNGVSGWVLGTPGPITLGTTALSFTQFHGAGTYTAGTGLSLTGGEFSVSTIPVANGGTNITSYAAGDMIYASAANVLGKLTKGTANQLMGMNSAGTFQEYKTINGNAAATAGTAGNIVISHGANSLGINIGTNVVTLGDSQALTNKTGYNGLVITANTGVITTGTWSASTIAVNRGGTGATALTSNGVVFGNGTNAVGVTAAGVWDSANSIGPLLSINSSGTPTWTNTIDGGTF